VDSVTDWATIEPRFTRLRDFVLTDLEGFGENEEGGNFALVALVLTACDALGNLRIGGRGDGWRVFERCLPDEWKPVADILYDALRHGLIHDYDAKLVIDEKATISFAIGWYRESADLHMKFVSGERNVLYIQAQSLVGSLREAFDAIEDELRADAELRDQFLTRDRKGREVHVRANDAERWRTAVSKAGVAGAPNPPGTPTFFTTSTPVVFAGATGSPGPSPATAKSPSD
jgi:hypothetical protein